MKNGGRSDADFQRMRCVLACIGKDKMRPELHRVLVEKAGGGITITATDGIRLRRDHFGIKAEAGLYEIGVNNSREVRLVPSKLLVRFPDYRKAIPSTDAKSAYKVSGKGRRFAGWVGSALGCHVDPALIALGKDEAIEVFVQKADGAASPLVMRNGTTLALAMPMKLDDGIGEALDSIQLDRLRRKRKMTAIKPRPQPKADTVPWWPFRQRKKAA